MNTYAVVEKSCYRRREEVFLARTFMSSNVWIETSDVCNADVVIYYGCAGLRFLIEESASEITELRKKMKLGAELIVGGCLPGMDFEHLRRCFDGRTITPTDLSALNDLPNIIVPVDELPGIWGRNAAPQQLKKPRTRQALAMRIDHTIVDLIKPIIRLYPHRSLKKRALRLQRRHTIAMPIAAGCNRKCAYCVKPMASGRIRSKPIDIVTRNVSQALELGYRAFDFHADSIGNYGLDLEVNFGDLLDSISRIERRFSVGLFDLHPQDFIRYFDPIKRLCRDGKIHYLYVAVQSGNGRVLRTMKRPCDVEEMASKLVQIRRLDHIFMQSGIVVGFPGETDEEFEDTIRLLERVDFDDVYVHHYCDMPNAEASSLPEKVPQEAMNRRFAAIMRSRIRHNLAATRHEWKSNPAPEYRAQ